jgi:hypothetical protein
MTKAKRPHTVIVFVNDNSYVEVGSFKSAEAAKRKAKSILLSGARGQGDEIRVSVWDENLDWGDNQAWTDFFWNDQQDAA